MGFDQYIQGFQEDSESRPRRIFGTFGGHEFRRNTMMGNMSARGDVLTKYKRDYELYRESEAFR
jgi:hypothetical protein